jgi:hypothetical protein
MDAVSILVVGASPGDERWQPIARAFGSAAARLVDADVPGRVDFVVGVIDEHDDEPIDTIDRCARATRLPVLDVKVHDRRVLVGPLALPTRPRCCRRCVHGRVGAGLTLVRPTLDDEIDAILRDPRASRLLDHVLSIDRQSGRTTWHRIESTSCGHER